MDASSGNAGDVTKRRDRAAYMRSYRARKKGQVAKADVHAACDAEIRRLTAEVRRLQRIIDGEELQF